MATSPFSIVQEQAYAQKSVKMRFHVFLDFAPVVNRCGWRPFVKTEKGISIGKGVEQTSLIMFGSNNQGQ